ncbi:MAG: BLUF domain-containing protein [Terrimicrobiaceae bacterium]
MRRLVYLSRFARDLTPADIQSIGQKSRQRNRERGVTGFLVCLGDIFFQVLEGSAEAVMELYSQQILNDDRHKDVVCLRNESFGPIRMFPEWDMNVIDLNDPAEKLPMAFREMAGILMDALYTLNVYSQPTVTRLLEQGINPVHSAPVRKHVTVMFTDLLGFTSLSEKLSPNQALDIVNRHFDTCASVISRNGGEVNKLLGDGLLAYFPQAKIVEAMTAAREIIDAMGKRRAAARLGSVDRVVIAGVGLCYGLVTEGNVGGRSKKEFTIMGRTVNLAARLEALTRELKVPVVMSKELADAASGMYPIRSLGRQPVRGLADGLEVFGFADLDPIDPVQIYSDIDTSFFSR